MSVPKSHCIFRCDVLHKQYVPVHRFPHPERHPELFAAWMAVMREKLHNVDKIKIYTNKRVCDQHFVYSQKLRCGRILRTAVPSINLKRLRQTIFSIVNTDHNYCFPSRVFQMSLSTAFTTNTSDPSTPEASAVQSTVYPTPSVPISTTCPTLANTVESTSREDTVIDKSINVAINDDDDDTTEVVTDPCYDTTEVINELCDITTEVIYDQYDETEVITDPCDDANVSDDVVVPNTPMPDSVRLRQELFSWEKQDTNTIIADDTMVSNPPMEAPDLTLDFGDVSMYDEFSSKDDLGSQFSDYRCNNCGEKVTGFRYTCVQCADWDLCAACEARAAHATHYVLRVPGERPYNEVKTILMALRQYILSENMFLTETIASVKIEEEVKDEEIQVIEGSSELEGDPLGAWNVSQHDYTCDTLENNPEPNENSLHRNRRASIDSLGNTQNRIPRDNSPCRPCSNLVTEADDELMETDNDSTRSDDNQTSNPKFDYSEPIKIIDIEKLTRTQQIEQNSEQNDTDLQMTKENSITVVGRLDDIDTCKPKELTGQEKLVDTSPKTPLKTFNYTQSSKTHGEQIRTENKGIGTDDKGIAHRIWTTKMGSYGNRIGTRSTVTIGDKTMKRYKILIPHGTHWQDVLKMLKSRATVPLTDVMRKNIMKKKIEIKKI